MPSARVASTLRSEWKGQASRLATTVNTSPTNLAGSLVTLSDSFAGLMSQSIPFSTTAWFSFLAQDHRWYATPNRARLCKKRMPPYPRGHKHYRNLESPGKLLDDSH